MSLLRNCILPITLGLFLTPIAFAGDDDKKGSDKKIEEQTIHGIVSEVTLVGETDIDNKTGKAVTAEQVYLTIVGHAAWSREAMEKEKAREHASNEKDRDRDVQRTSADASRSSERSHHRMNVYVIAVTDKTKVCECKESGKEGSASAKEEKCDLDKLEIGDRVEVCFDAKMADKEKDAKAEPQKHGRHRVYFGMAKDIKILDEPMDMSHAAAKDKEDNKK